MSRLFRLLFNMLKKDLFIQICMKQILSDQLHIDYKFYSKLPVPTTAIVLHAKSRAEVLGERGTILNMDELDAFFKKKVAVRIRINEEHRFGPIVVL